MRPGMMGAQQQHQRYLYGQQSQGFPPTNMAPEGIEQPGNTPKRRKGSKKGELADGAQTPPFYLTQQQMHVMQQLLQNQVGLVIYII